ILPHLEQDNLWKTWDHFVFDNNSKYPPIPSGVQWAPGCFMRQVVKTLVCPSNTNAGNPMNQAADPTTSNHYFVTSYFANGGTRGYPRWIIPPDPAVRPTLFDYRDGVFDQNRQHRMADITDGTTNTLMFGERHYYDPVFDTPVPAFDHNDRIADWGWCWFGAQGDAFLGANVRINFRLPANWAMLPPAQAQVLFDDRINAYGSGPPGGANFALADGSVRFIRESISPLTLRALGTRAGGEPAPGDF